MKKISNRMSVKKSSTLAGQRELLREHTNKINELVESITNLENREAKHELDVITSMQYLENRVEELKDELKMLTTEVHVNLDKPYTAMRSTGEYCECKEPCPIPDQYLNPSTRNLCYRCYKQIEFIKPQEDIDKFVDYSIKKYGKTYKALGNSQEDVRKKLMDYLKKINNPHSEESWLSIEEQADKILAIVKGE